MKRSKGKEKHGKFTVKGRTVPYRVSYRKVKYARLEFDSDGLLLVVNKWSGGEREILKAHRDWIYEKSSQFEVAVGLSGGNAIRRKLNPRRFEEFVRQRVKRYSSVLGVRVNRVIFRKMVSQWGSMSVTGDMRINSYAAYLPTSLIEYLVFHEVAHVREPSHDATFKKIIEDRFPDKEAYEKELNTYWMAIQEKIIKPDLEIKRRKILKQKKYET